MYINTLLYYQIIRFTNSNDSIALGNHPISVKYRLTLIGTMDITLHIGVELGSQQQLTFSTTNQNLHNNLQALISILHCVL